MQMLAFGEKQTLPLDDICYLAHLHFGVVKRPYNMRVEKGKR